MRTILLVAGLACAVLTAQVGARSIPDPGKRTAPANEAPPIPRAGYSVATNYQLQCVGCHLPGGEGSPHNDTPRMRDFVGHFLKVEGGREFLVRVPGAAQSALSNQQLAELLNWLLRADGMAGSSMPAGFTPYSAEEIAAIRHEAILNLPDTRAQLIAKMRALGIEINDGMEHP